MIQASVVEMSPPDADGGRVEGGVQAAFDAVSLARKPRARSKEMDAVGPPADAAMERSGQWGSARAAARSPTLEGMPRPPWA